VTNNRIKTRRKTTATASKPKAKAKPKDNMRIWNQVCETDPKFTKAVGFRGGFTSIDPQYQLHRMTEMFGPIGKGWGFEESTGKTVIDSENIVWETSVTVWWRDESNEVRFLGAVTAASMYVSDGRPDLDAPKKAQTDALTKSFSRLGLSADVFLGQFDDPEYVREMEKKFDGPASEEQIDRVKAIAEDKDDEWRDKVLKHFEVETFDGLLKSQAETIINRVDNKS
tara:strand:+ start:703 stop:1380 length:678 start_codon:yes stop_codon:yes gene_type:complete